MAGEATSPAGLVLAAGPGTRLGMPKALLEIEDSGSRVPLLRDRLEMLRRAGCRPRVAVLGAEVVRVQALVERSGAAVVVAEQWATGQSASLGTGLRWLQRTDAPAAVVTLVDQPLVTVAAVERLVRAWRAGAEVAAAAYSGRLRPPVLFAASVWPSVLESLAGDRGAGPWLRRHAGRVTEVEVGDVADAQDIDTPEDLARLARARRTQFVQQRTGSHDR